MLSVEAAESAARRICTTQRQLLVHLLVFVPQSAEHRTTIATDTMLGQKLTELLDLHPTSTSARYTYLPPVLSLYHECPARET